MQPIYDEIFSYVQSLPIIDTHEHLPYREDQRETDTDVLREYLVHYFSSDLVAAGMKRADMEAARDVSKPLMERWKMVEPYWQLARNTGYGRALDLTVQKLYGFPRIDASTIEGVNEAFRKTLQPGQNHYRHVLKDLCNIEFSVLDSDFNCDREFFRTIYNLDELVLPKSWDAIDELSQDTGMSITSFDDYLQACDAMIQLALDKGAVALKCHAAYFRSLRFDNVPRCEAERCFRDMLDVRGRSAWNPRPLQTAKAFQDYMMHHVLHCASRHRLTVQIHTGLQESGNNDIANANPTLLSNLFIQYPEVKFDIFHIGYPYYHEMAALGKMFHNVYLDMCWAHIISPAASMQALDEWLDSVPVNKILAFGGDYQIIDAVYAHQLMARQHVSKVLARKVAEGIFTMKDAKWMARRMFYDNPKALFDRA